MTRLLSFRNVSFLPAQLLGVCIFILVSAGCGKADDPTYLKGKVTDRKTGLPIAEAKFTLDLRPGTGSATDIFYTDADGMYDHLVSADMGSIHGASTVSKEGYVSRMQLGFQTGKENEIDISLLPRNAVLRLTVLNESGDTRPIYLQVTNPTLGADSKQPPYHVETKNNVYLSKDESFSSVYTLPESMTLIYWDFQAFISPGSTFKDSVFVLANDTTEYKISF